MKIQVLASCAFLSLSILVMVAAGSQPAVEVAKQFTPLGSAVAHFVTYSSTTGQIIEEQPAVLRAHLVSGDSDDIVAAYSSRPDGSIGPDIVVRIFHNNGSSYVQIGEFTYKERRLWVQDFRTFGLNILKLTHDGQYALVVTTEVGASAGGHLEVMRWEPKAGFVSCFKDSPPPAFDFNFHETVDTSEITLSFNKYPGQLNVRLPLTYIWRDGVFVPK